MSSVMSERARSEPLLRGMEHEEEDAEQTIRRFVDAAYRDWPNDAGFEGLTEERGPIEVPVAGRIPPWVAGSLYRTGPGEHRVEDAPGGTYYTSHWFDGLAHSHRFDIVPGQDGQVKVSYSSRRQADDWVAHIRKSRGRDLFTFAQRADPCVGLFSKMMAVWRSRKLAQGGEEYLTNPNVVVLPNMPGPGTPEDPINAGDGAQGAELPKHVWITTDNSVLTQVDPRTLEPIRVAAQQSLHPELKGPLSCAHAQRDPITGDLYNWNLELGPQPTYRLFCTSAASGKTDILAVIREPGLKAAYWHSFYLSTSFAVLCIPSSHLALRGLKVAWKRNLLDAMEPFDSTKKCQWVVVDRVHGQGVVARFETDAGFFFHTINAFEEDSDTNTEKGRTLFCEVVEYETLDIMSHLYYDVLLRRDGADRKVWSDEKRIRNSMTRLVRYVFRIPAADEASRPKRITVKPGEVVFSIPSPHCGDLPTINPRFATRRHRYVYGLPWTGRSTAMDGIVKTDTVTREALFWAVPQGHSPGEAIFVPRPGAAEDDEDDGVLLSVVLDGHARKSYLLCLDARTMTELGRAEVPVAIGFGFHGAHVSTASSLTPPAAT